MEIITTSDDRKIEVIKKISHDWLVSLGKEKAEAYLNRQFVDVILRYPEQPIYILGREIIDCGESKLYSKDQEIPPDTVNLTPKKKRGRPKKCIQLPAQDTEIQKLADIQ